MAENEIGIVDSGTYYTPESSKMRRRLAEAMLKAGMETSPIRSHWQGLARIAQAMLGGYTAHKLEREEKQGQKALGDLTAGRYGLGPSLSTSPESSQPPSIPNSALGDMPANAPADKIALGRKIVEELKRLDPTLTDTQAAAVAANMVWEGGGKTDLVNAGDNWRNSPRSPHSVGLGQWNDRAPALIKYARQQGIDIPEGNLLDARYMQDVIKRIPLETQLGFALSEWQGPEGRAYAMLRAAPDDMAAALKGAISYHRPRGWTWSNPAAGHGFQGRAGIAKQLIEDLGRNPLQPVKVAQAPGAVTDGQPLVPPPGIVLEPGAASEASAAAAPAPAMPSVAPAAAATTAPAAPQMAAPPSVLGEVGTPVLSQQEALAEAWKSLGPRGALVQTMLRSPDPRIRGAAEAEIKGALGRVMAAQPPIEPKKQAELAYTLSQIRENEAELPKKQAEARKATVEALAAERDMKPSKEELALRLQGMVENLAQVPHEYGRQATERAVGPYSGANITENEGGYVGSVINAIPTAIAKMRGELAALYQGGANPSEVRRRIEGDTQALVNLMKPYLRVKGEGAQSNYELQQLQSAIGQVVQARTVEEYNRGVEDLRHRLTGMIGVEVPAAREQKRSGAGPAYAEEVTTGAEAAVDTLPAGLKSAAERALWMTLGVPARPEQPKAAPSDMTEVQKLLMERMIAKGTDPAVARDIVMNMLKGGQ
jgi:hypothetical protein